MEENKPRNRTWSIISRFLNSQAIEEAEKGEIISVEKEKTWFIKLFPCVSLRAYNSKFIYPQKKYALPIRRVVTNSTYLTINWPEKIEFFEKDFKEIEENKVYIKTPNGKLFSSSKNHLYCDLSKEEPSSNELFSVFIYEYIDKDSPSKQNTWYLCIKTNQSKFLGLYDSEQTPKIKPFTISSSSSSILPKQLLFRMHFQSALRFLLNQKIAIINENCGLKATANSVRIWSTLTFEFICENYFSIVSCYNSFISCNKKGKLSLTISHDEEERKTEEEIFQLEPFCIVNSNKTFLKKYSIFEENPNLSFYAIKNFKGKYIGLNKENNQLEASFDSIEIPCLFQFCNIRNSSLQSFTNIATPLSNGFTLARSSAILKDTLENFISSKPKSQKIKEENEQIIDNEIGNDFKVLKEDNMKKEKKEKKKKKEKLKNEIEKIEEDLSDNDNDNNNNNNKFQNNHDETYFSDKIEQNNNNTSNNDNSIFNSGSLPLNSSSSFSFNNNNNNNNNSNPSFDSIWKIDYSELEFQSNKILGQGYFGKVLEAKWQGTFTAVKFIFRDNFRSNNEFELFLHEFHILSSLHHPSIVQLLGFSFDKLNRFCIVSEYMSKGSLYDFIRKNRWDLFLGEDEKKNSNDKNSKKQMKRINVLRFKFCQSICQGMSYMHSRNLLHRDLTSKNVLINEYYIAKVADFGLSLAKGDISHSLSKATGALLSLAPEVFTKKEFSEASDVFSFGVIVWETFSITDPKGENEEFVEYGKKVSQGFRPRIPSHCPRRWQDLIEFCWEQKKEYRPSFKQILITLSNFEEEKISNWDEYTENNDLNNSSILTNLNGNENEELVCDDGGYNDVD